MKIAIASDHGGYQLKEEIKKYLEGRNIEVVDLGTNSEESVDYPIYGKACGEAVMSGKADRGIVCCGTGIGISIAAEQGGKASAVRFARMFTWQRCLANITIPTCCPWAAERRRWTRLWKS